MEGSALRLSFPGGSYSSPMQGRGRGGGANLMETLFDETQTNMNYNNTDLGWKFDYLI